MSLDFITEPARHVPVIYRTDCWSWGPVPVDWPPRWLPPARAFRSAWLNALVATAGTSL
jgi:hypothetical protein